MVNYGRLEYPVQGELDSTSGPGGSTVPSKSYSSSSIIGNSLFLSPLILSMSFTSFSLQDTLLREVKSNPHLQQTGTPPTPKTHKWSYASAFLYSLTLITTIGESHFVFLLHCKYFLNYATLSRGASASGAIKTLRVALN